MKQRRLANLLTGLLGVVFLVTAVWGLLNRQYLQDWLQAEQFTADGSIVRLVSNTTMTDYGRMLFYASQPKVEPAEDFNISCAGFEEGSAVLGCYFDRRIYIYDINNQELDGIKEVTAAHEMLHAAYDRLSSKERREVDALLEEVGNKLSRDQQFSQRLEAYGFASHAEKLNELHSIVGTEITDIDYRLEKHYARYFNDRQAIVAMHTKYQAVFAKYKQQADELVVRIDQLAETINSLSRDYLRSAEQLQADIQEFKNWAKSDQPKTQQDFNFRRSQLEARSDQIDRQYDYISSKRSEYHALVDEYNDIAVHLSQLASSIDSRIERHVREY